MKERKKVIIDEEKQMLISNIIGSLKDNDLEKSELLLEVAIGRYPHDPEPHNLYGILFEKKFDHNMAMKHFRAAWDLDPTYLPARHNLEHYGTFNSRGHCAYEVSDCNEENNDEHSFDYKIDYDIHSIGHINRRYKNEI
jgi:lipoprotein NlpI